MSSKRNPTQLKCMKHLFQDTPMSGLLEMDVDTDMSRLTFNQHGYTMWVSTRGGCRWRWWWWWGVNNEWWRSLVTPTSFSSSFPWFCSLVLPSILLYFLVLSLPSYSFPLLVPLVLVFLLARHLCYLSSPPLYLLPFDFISNFLPLLVFVISTSSSSYLPLPSPVLPSNPLFVLPLSPTYIIFPLVSDPSSNLPNNTNPSFHAFSFTSTSLIMCMDVPGTAGRYACSSWRSTTEMPSKPSAPARKLASRIFSLRPTSSTARPSKPVTMVVYCVLEFLPVVLPPSFG